MDLKGLLLFLHIIYGVLADPWSLNGLTGPGPDKWPDIFHLCGGDNQSPIDVPEYTEYDSSIPPFEFVGYENLGIDDVEIVNIGYSAALQIKNSSLGKAYYTGGGFSGKYIASCLHIHWGEDDRSGSDHSFQGKHFPAELHMGHYKEEYGSMIPEALKHPDGVTALAFFFELSEEDDPQIEPYIKASANVPYEDDRAPFGAGFATFMPDDLSQFYQYSGSLPLPPCLEIVVWTLFKKTNTISSAQLMKLRQLYDRQRDVADPHHITGNQRPVQPLNDRVVKRSFPDDSSDDDDSNGSHDDDDDDDEDDDDEDD